MPLALTNALWEVAYAYHAEAEEDLTDSGRVVSKPEVIQMAPRGSVTISPSVVSEATAEEELRSLENVWRSLLIQRLEGSRWRLRRTRSAMGFESTLGWKLLV
jgi:hypothetical protein